MDPICNQWFLHPFLVKRENGTAEFSVGRETMLGFLPPFLLSFGKEVDVLEPPELRRALSALARELADYYGAL